MAKRVVSVKSGQPFDVYVGRPSVWGNPFRIGVDGSRAEVIEKYRAWLMKRPDLIKRAHRELRGKVLACHCSPLPCHAEMLVEFSESEREQSR